MDPLLKIVLIVLVIGLLFGGGFYAGPSGAYPYRTGGWSIGGILIFVLVVLLHMGRI
ncbi:DUF3309 domain-containing protein [Methylobacterium terricola]|uniref:DUF3309 domain-containing protein n=1 Tax=Methylobacterium terricola TaxID=2583531 RepID=A0A5C4LLG8_9HYPH|nr:DUF3309 domain-containing protein [Methylobacterium terricola]TNC14893.1 DUF3309 domain-containing protein [Methylobacterium terricola]